MILYDDALRILKELAGPRLVATEEVRLQDVTGRVAAADVFSGESVPPFDNSAMDGFAVVAAQTVAATPVSPVELSVLGCVAAGDGIVDGSRCAEHTAFEIMTGAPMPSGRYDSVVKIEDVKVLRDGAAPRIVLTRPVRRGDNVRRRGEDFRAGQPVVSAGTVLGAEHVLALASVGIDAIEVRRRPRIAVINTGKELVHHSARELAPGMIRNSTGPYLATILPQLGAEVVQYDTVHDEPERFLEALARIERDAPDVIITTGAVSMGKYDFVGAVLEQKGASIRFHKAAIRPGKPILCAEFPGGGPVLFGIPGNPVSTAVGVRFFVSPYLRTIAGQPPERPLRLRLAESAKKPEGLRCFFKAATALSDATVRSLPGQASFMVSPLLTADGWVVFPETGREIAKGELVDVYPLVPGELKFKEGGCA